MKCLPCIRPKQVIQPRLIRGPKGRLAIIQAAQQGHERGLAAHKGLRPINGVQNPRGVCGAGVIGKLLPLHSIMGVMGQNQSPQRRFQGAVNGRHGTGIILQRRGRRPIWRDLADGLAKRF